MFFKSPESSDEMRRSWVVGIFALGMTLGSDGWAASSLAPQFTLEGRLLTPDQSAPITDVVDFTIGIYSPDGLCLLYEESQQNVDLSTSSGFYQLLVGSNTGNAKRVSGRDPGLSFTQIFSNTASAPIVGASGTCPASYTPAAGELRNVRIQVTLHSTGVTETLSPDLVISPVPQATVAETAEKVRVSGSANSYGFTMADLDAILGPAGPSGASVADASSYHHHDSLYLLKSGSSGASLPIYSGAPSTPAQGSMWVNSADGGLYYHDGTSAVKLGSGGGSGTITGVTAGTGLSGGGSTGSVTLNVTSGNLAESTSSVLTITGGTGAVVGAGTTIQVKQATTSQDGYLSSSDWNTFSGKLSSSGSTTNGNLAQWNGSGQLLDGPACTSANTADAVVKRDTSGNFSAGTITSSGLVTAALQVTGGTPGSGKVLTSDGSGNATWQAPGSQWTTSGSNIYYNSGNVGIGTTAPTSLLHISKNQNLPTGILLQNSNTGSIALAMMQFSNNLGARGTIGLSSSNYVDSNYADRLTLESTGNGLGFSASDVTGDVRFFAGGATSERMRITSTGNVGIGTTSPSNTLHVVGSLCVKSGAGNCAGSTAGTIYATTTTVSSADYAEYFMAEMSLEPGDIVGLNPATGLARGYQAGDWLLGVVSTSPGVVGNSGIRDQQSVLVALMGQVPFNKNNVKIENSVVSTLDGKGIGYLLANGHVYVNIGSANDTKADKAEVMQLRDENAQIKTENAQIKTENAQIKRWLCQKDPSAPFCQ